jgi:hypothetical protein
MRRAVVAALALALAAVIVPGGAQAKAPAWHAWSGVSGDDAGHGVVSRGEAIWTNELFDDYGANVDGFTSMDPDVLIGIMSPHVYPADPQHPAGFSPTGNVGRFRHSGDYGYPPDKSYPHDPANDPLGDTTSYQNVANVTEVRVAADREDVFLRFALSDLGGDPALTGGHPHPTVIALAIDTDPSDPSGGGAWPYSAEVSSPGWKRLLTVWGTGGTLTTPDGAAKSLTAVGGAVREDLAANTIEVRLPLSSVAPGGQRHWRLIAGAGRWDPGARAWAVPELTTNETTSPGNLGTHPRVYELPFHHGEPNSMWHDTKQAADLASGDIASDSWDVELGALQAGTSVPAPCHSGPREETFNAYPTGASDAEGMQTLPTQNGGAANLHNVNEIYRWHVQPLALVLPPSGCRAAASAPSLDYVFHPGNVNQNAWTVGIEGAHERVNYLHDPPLGYRYVTELAERYNRITASGLARSEGWNYGDVPGEEAADLNAIDAVTRRYRFDRDRVRAVGMSGRNGPNFFAETWPDRVSSFFTVSPHGADSPKFANLRNTPWVFLQGTAFLEADSDLPSYDVDERHMSSLGYQFLRMIWNGRGHDFNLLHDAYAVVEPWTSAPRIHPARITYDVEPKDKRPGVPLFPGVDWATHVTLADPQRRGQIDLTDLARAEALPARETRFDCEFLNAGSGDDVEYRGLSYDPPAAVLARMPDRVEPGWSVKSPCTFDVKPLARPASANAISGSLHNVSSLSVDAGRMGIDTTRPVGLDALHTETPATLHVRSPRGDLTVRLPVSRCAREQALRYDLHGMRGARVVQATLWVGRHRRALVHGHSLTTVTIPRPTDDSFTVRIRTRSTDGATVTSVRRYDGCQTSKPRITRSGGR